MIKKRKDVTRSRNKRKRKEKFRGEKAATRVFYHSLLKKGNNKIIKKIRTIKKSETKNDFELSGITVITRITASVRTIRGRVR